MGYGVAEEDGGQAGWASMLWTVELCGLEAISPRAKQAARSRLENLASQARGLARLENFTSRSEPTRAWFEPSWLAIRAELACEP